MSSPWAKIPQPNPVNLADIMSEEYARDRKREIVSESKEHGENFDIGSKLGLNSWNVGNFDEVSPSVLHDIIDGSPIFYDTDVTENIPDEVLKAISNDSIENDSVIAQLLQMQFDKEHDEMLKRTEEKFNGTSKVSVSFKNFERAQNLDFECDSETEEIEDYQDRKDWDRYDALERDIASIPGCGYKIQPNGSIITKHDLVNNGRKNACKLMSFPPEFQTGDGEKLDLKLSNSVFNNLKRHSNKEQIRQYRLNDKKEDKSSVQSGDRDTRLLIYKLVNGGLVSSVNGLISSGKEAYIVHAVGNQEYPHHEAVPKECVLKVFKTVLNDFKRRKDYIQGDARFTERIGNQVTRKVLNMWVEKEMANLMRLRKAGVKCPQVVSHKNNVIIMSLIGENSEAAPKLKDAVMNDADYIIAYEQVVETMNKMYHDANLIHADLSEYNILWFNDSCYFIDVSQSVEPVHTNAFMYLYRDCCNMINFFRKKGVPNIMTADELFKQIVECDYNDKLALLALQESFKMKPHLVGKPGVESSFAFNSIWERNRDGTLPKYNLKNKVPNTKKVF